MRYLVTGATGFVGGRVARQLVAAGHQVVTLARTPSRAHDLRELGVQVFEGDITDKATLRAPMVGADGVFHIAGWYKLGTREGDVGRRINVDGTRNVLETMRDLGIPRGVYTSTLAVFSDTHGRVPDETYRRGGPWLTTYDRTKWQAHYEVVEPMIADGLPLVVVQPGLIYGPGDTSPMHDTLVAYLRRRLPLVPDRAAYCWGHVDDTARGHIQALEQGRLGETYIIAGPVHTLADALRMAERITGIRAPRLHAPPALLKAAAALLAPIGAILPLPSTYQAEVLRSGAGVTYLGSSAKAERELGFRVRPLEQGLPETLAYEMDRLGMAARR